MLCPYSAHSKTGVAIEGIMSRGQSAERDTLPAANPAMKKDVFLRIWGEKLLINIDEVLIVVTSDMQWWNKGRRRAGRLVRWNSVNLLQPDAFFLFYVSY